MSRSRRLRNKRKNERGKSQAGTLNMVVAASPSSSLNVSAEIELVKAALLYGDRVTVLSPVMTMLDRVREFGSISSDHQIELMSRVAPYLMGEGEEDELQAKLAKLQRFLRNTANTKTAEAMAARTRFDRELRPFRLELRELTRELVAVSRVEELAPALSRGLVRIESTDPGDQLDLIASSIISAKLAETGKKNDDTHMDRVVDTFVAKLSKQLSSGRSYLLLDESVASLTAAAIREGLFKPAKGPSGRAAQAMAASGLMGRLPTFPEATVDEVLDIRTELSPSLVNFRGAIVSVARTFSAQAWEEDFEDDLQDAWIETVAPALCEIESAVNENKSLSSAAGRRLSAGIDALPGLWLVGAGMALHGHEALTVAVSGGVAAAVPLLKHAIRTRMANSDVQMKPFYFLHNLEQSLRGRA